MKVVRPILTDEFTSQGKVDLIDMQAMSQNVQADNGLPGSPH